MIPLKVIKAMKVIINKKNFNNDLTKMCYVKSKNMFVGSDNFMLFEFTPKEQINCKEDFSITYIQLGVIEKLSTEMGACIAGIFNISDEKIIKFIGQDGDFYLPFIEHKFPQYNQDTLFGKQGNSINGLVANDSLIKYLKAVNIITDSYPQIEITENVYFLSHEDEYGKYIMSCRLPTLENK